MKKLIWGTMGLLTMVLSNSGFAQNAPLFTYTEQKFVRLIEDQALASGERFEARAFQKVYKDKVYSSNYAKNTILKQQAKVDCDSIKVKFEEKMNQATVLRTDGNSYMVHARFGDIQQTEPIYGIWKAPLCIIDLQVSGKVVFERTLDIFKGRNSEQECNQLKQEVINRDGMIQAKCNYVAGARLKYELRTLSVK